MSIIVFIGEIGILWLLRIRHLFGGDSAEYVTIAHTWSIAHPPGYPLYSLLVNLDRLTHIDPSLVMLSSIPTVIASYVLYRTFLLFRRNKTIALIPAVLYVFLFPVWLYSEVPEVFAMNSMFIAIITYILLSAYLQKKRGVPLRLFFVFGLSLTNHQTILLYLPGWYILAKSHLRSCCNTVPRVLKAFGALLIGLSVYIYAPIAGSFNPPLDFENASTLQGFLRLVTRATYGTFKSYQGSKPDLLTQFLGMGSSFIYILLDFRVIGALFIILGLIWLYRYHRTLFVFAAVTVLCHLVFFFYINFSLINPFGAATYERFLIGYYYILVLLFGLGMQYVLSYIQSIRLSHKELSWIKNISFYLFGISFVFIVFISNYRTIHYVNAIHQFDSFATDILNNLPKNAILATTSDNSTFTVDYYYFVKRYRPDIKLLSVGIFNRSYYQNVLKKKYPELDFHGLEVNNLAEFIRSNSKKFPVFFESPVVSGNWVPYGLTWKYYRTDSEAKKDSSALVQANNSIWHSIHIPAVNAHQSNIYHLKTLRDDYVGKLLSYVRYLYSLKEDALASSYIDVILHNDPENREAQGLRLRIQSRNYNCSAAEKTYKTYRPGLNFDSLSQLTDALNYIYICDKQNPEANKFVNQYRRIDVKEQAIQPTPSSQNTKK